LSIDRDQTLVVAAARGDLAAFEALVQRHREVVHRVAARVVGEQDAEDVAQDAFLRAFHRLGNYRGEAAFRSWLLQIAHNGALDALARKRASTVPLDTVEEEGARDPGAQRTPADRLESRERRDRLDVKLKGLSPAHRVVLVLRDVEGFSYDEIAEITQAPLGSVKGRLHRARQELVELLRTNTYDWELPR
jgi:RNA polymerase sigma-70 factor (ECF subfamily)